MRYIVYVLLAWALCGCAEEPISPQAATPAYVETCWNFPFYREGLPECEAPAITPISGLPSY